MKVIGMIIPDSGNGFFVDLAQHFQRSLTSERYAVVVVSSDGSQRREQSHLNLLRDMEVHGIVFIGAEHHMPTYALLRELDLPTLILDREVPLVETADAVILDNRQGVLAAVEHLAELGHTRIAHVEGNLMTEPGKVRMEAFEEVCERHALVSERLPGDFSYSAGRKAAEALLARDHGDRPTALVAGNDLAAIGAIQAFHEHQVRVPHDISVVGFDDIEISSWIYPRLTTVRQDRGEMARVGADLLAKRLAHSDVHGSAFPLPSRYEYVTPELIVRSSTAPPRDETRSPY